MEEQQRLAMMSLNRPAAQLPYYSGYTGQAVYDPSKTGALTDWYARMLNVPWAMPFVAQNQIQGPDPDASIFSIDNLLDPVTIPVVTEQEGP